MPSIALLMEPTKSTSFFVAYDPISPVFLLSKWHKLLSTASQILCPKLRAFNVFKSLLRVWHLQLQRSLLVVALLVLDVAAGMAPATSSPVTDRVVPNPLKVTDHHGARFAAWTTTMLIGVGNAMIDPNMILRRILQKLSTLHALCLPIKPLIGSWTQGFRLIWLQPTPLWTSPLLT